MHSPGGVAKMLPVIVMVGLVVGPRNETAFGSDAGPMLPNRLPKFEQAAEEAGLVVLDGPSTREDP